MEGIPTGVKIETIQENTSNTEKPRGIRLHVPTGSKVESDLRRELIEVILDPNKPSFIRIILEDFGFAVLHGLTLLPEEREKITMKELDEEENYKPLMWHTDGGAVKLPAFSALFSDVSGPVRLSQTVISHVDDIFPSLICSADQMLEKLERLKAPDELQKSWIEARKKLQLVLSPKAKRQRIWDQVIHHVLHNFICVLKLTTVDEYITKGENKAIINDSIAHAQTAGRVYLHQWGTPQTLLISNKEGIIHCRKSVRRSKEPGGKLFAKAVRAT
jgi:hypothetical protein